MTNVTGGMFTEKQGFLAFLDVIGTSKAGHEQQEKIAQILVELQETIIPQLRALDPSNDRKYLEPESSWLISDSLIIAFPRTEHEAYTQNVHYRVNNVVGALVASALLEGVLLRGSVGYGEMKLWKFGVWGVSSEDAKLEFEQAEWAGVHYGPLASKTINGWVKKADSEGWKFNSSMYADVPEVKLHHRVVEVPFKDRYKKRWTGQSVTWDRFTVPWPWYVQRIFHIRDQLSLKRETAHTRVMRALEPLLEHSDEPVRRKAVNTIKYFNDYISLFPAVNEALDMHGRFPADPTG